MTVGQFIIEQSKKFEMSLSDKVKNSQPTIPVITVAMEPGSGGLLIASNTKVDQENLTFWVAIFLYTEN